MYKSNYKYKNLPRPASIHSSKKENMVLPWKYTFRNTLKIHFSKYLEHTLLVSHRYNLHVMSCIVVHWSPPLSIAFDCPLIISAWQCPSL